MGTVLTQSEIDRLFQQAREKHLDEVLPDQPASYYKYDFHAEQKIGGERKRSLHALHSFFIRIATSTLSTLLRTTPEMSLAAVNQLTYGDYLEAAPSPGCFYVVTAKQLEQDFVVDLALPIAYSIVDRLLGGQGGAPKFGTRELSEIEQSVVSRLIAFLLEDLQKAWAKFRDLEFEIKTNAGDPQFVQLVPPTEAVIIVSIAVRLLNVEDSMNFVFPASLLEQGLPKIHVSGLRPARQKQDTSLETQILQQQMKEVPVPVVARLGHTVISFEDLMDLEDGDVLTLDRLVREPVELVVGDEVSFHGEPGHYRGHRAVKVISEAKEPPDHGPHPEPGTPEG